MAVARGVVLQLSGESLTLSTDKPLPPQFARHLRGDGAGAAAGPRGLIGRSYAPEETPAPEHSWRLDKDEVASVFVRLRRNLMGGGTLFIAFDAHFRVGGLPFCRQLVTFSTGIELLQSLKRYSHSCSDPECCQSPVDPAPYVARMI